MKNQDLGWKLFFGLSGLLQAIALALLLYILHRIDDISNRVARLEGQGAKVGAVQQINKVEDVPL